MNGSNNPKVPLTQRFIIAIAVIGGGFIMLSILIGFSLNQSTNNTIFKDLTNLIIPLIGAWVGTVIAFYFGAENLQKAQETIDRLIRGRLRSKTIRELLDEYPSAKNVITMNIDDKTTIGEVKNELGNPKLKGGPLVLITEDDKIFGLFYHQHLTELYNNILATSNNNINAILNCKFLDHIDGIQDFITDGKWSKKEGIVNYANLTLGMTLETARELLESISDNAEVRGLVIENGNIAGIIDHEMIYESVIE